MKIAVIGQSLFGQEVYKALKNDGHTLVGVFTIPDKDGKADPLGEITIHLDQNQYVTLEPVSMACHTCLWWGLQIDTLIVVEQEISSMKLSLQHVTFHLFLHSP